MEHRPIRCAILNPLPGGGVAYHRDGALAAERARIAFVGDAADFERQGGSLASAERYSGVLMPPMLDVHTHVPQWPMRGGFLDGVVGDPPGGRLLAGLSRNVFPAEERFADEEQAELTIRRFEADALGQGVVGGCAFITSHPAAARRACELLANDWRIGPVLMDRDCPPSLRIEAAAATRAIEALADDYGPRVVPADRFVPACGRELRIAAVAASRGRGLRMQTHLAEQVGEVAHVRELRPDAASYTDVYRRDGLLDCKPIMAHCIWLEGVERAMLAEHGASVAHCPTSNTLLGSGIMPIPAMRDAGLSIALATDVGASPSTSLLAELRQFLLVHGASVTPAEGLWRITQAPAEILNSADRFGTLAAGKPLSYVLVDAKPAGDAAGTIRNLIGWQPPPGDVLSALADLRGGAASHVTIQRLHADFETAAGRVSPVDRVVVDARTRMARQEHEPPASS